MTGPWFRLEWPAGDDGDVATRWCHAGGRTELARAVRSAVRADRCPWVRVVACGGPGLAAADIRDVHCRPCDVLAWDGRGMPRATGSPPPPLAAARLAQASRSMDGLLAWCRAEGLLSDARSAGVSVAFAAALAGVGPALATGAGDGGGPAADRSD